MRCRRVWIAFLLGLALLSTGCSDDEDASADVLTDGMDTVRDQMDGDDASDGTDVSDAGDTTDAQTDQGDSTDQVEDAQHPDSDVQDMDSDVCPDVPCPEGEAVDSDDDGCPDVCCTCPTDFELSGYQVENGMCLPQCADASCGPDTPCSLYVCNLSSGSCDAPSGFCSDGASCGGLGCQADFEQLPQTEVCGCDGNTWQTECEMYCNGVALDHAGPCQ